MPSAWERSIELLGFFVKRVLFIPATKLHHFQTGLEDLLVLFRMVVNVMANRAFEFD